MPVAKMHYEATIKFDAQWSVDDDDYAAMCDLDSTEVIVQVPSKITQKITKDVTADIREIMEAYLESEDDGDSVSNLRVKAKNVKLTMGE